MLAGVGRFRVNVFRQRGVIGAAIRRVLPGTASFETLGLPAAVRALADEKRGLLLVTGMTGSGKTTTTAAMLNHINMTRRCHIITIEDPIEVLHEDKMAIVDQREIGIDTADFATALKFVARQDPDVIFIGEMRDVETVQAALQAAEHRPSRRVDAAHAGRDRDREPHHRLLPAAPADAGAPDARRRAARDRFSQRLLARADGRGRVPACEILVCNGRVTDMIVNPERTTDSRSSSRRASTTGCRPSTSTC